MFLKGRFYFPSIDIVSSSIDTQTSSSSFKHSAENKPASNGTSSSNDAAKLDMLTKIKNRLRGLIYIDQNLLSINRIILKYELNYCMLISDYFGFNPKENDDSVENMYFLNETRDEFLTRMITVQQELQRQLNMETNGNGNDFSSDILIKQVPKSLVALKYRTPFFYVNKISSYLEQNKDIEQNKLTEMYDIFYDLRSKLYESRDNIEQLNQLITNFAIPPNQSQ
jgi:hypothetical protein